MIGRHFDLLLLADVVGEANIDDRLADMQALDLVRRESKSDDRVFKHALVRDALYQSLLTERRKSLHLKIAEEIERRSGNRLTEMAEVLAHHYCQTDRAEKAFTYLSMAGTKSLGVYSLDEAMTHFTAARRLLDENPDCASDGQVADLLVPLSSMLIFTLKISATIDLLEHYLSRLNRLGDDLRVVLIRSNHVYGLWASTRFQEATTVLREIR